MTHDKMEGRKFSRQERPKNRGLERKSVLQEEIIVVRNRGALVGVRVGRRMVKFRAKSAGQPNNCVYCERHSSCIEAVYKTAAVRCCEDEACMKRAAHLAVIGG